MNNSPPVETIIAAMRGLLEARKGGKIKRITFLKSWGKLRALLTGTKEYQAWRQNVKSRAGGACEQCGEIGHHAHHKKQISRHLDKVLDPANGEFLCFSCHGSQPGHRLRGRRHSSNAAGRTEGRRTISSRTPPLNSGWKESPPDTPARRASMPHRSNS